MGLCLGDENPVEGVVVDHRQPAGPHAVRGSDGQTPECEVAHPLGQITRTFDQAEMLLEGDLPRRHGTDVYGVRGVEQVLDGFGQLRRIVEPPHDHAGIEEEAHHAIPKAAATLGCGSSKRAGTRTCPRSDPRPARRTVGRKEAATSSGTGTIGTPPRLTTVGHPPTS